MTDGLVLAADSGTVTVNQVGVPGGGTTSLSADGSTVTVKPMTAARKAR